MHFSILQELLFPDPLPLFLSILTVIMPFLAGDFFL